MSRKRNRINGAVRPWKGAIAGANGGTLPRTIDGGGMPTMRAEAFSAASRSHPDMRNWNPWPGSPDADILPERGVMSSRSRDLTRNHGVASGALQTQLDNVLGCGLWLAPTPDYTLLGRDRKWVSTWRRPVKALWRNWFETTWCDAGESLTGDGLASQIFTGAWLNGDGIALPMWLPNDPYAPASTRLQVIESDRLSNPGFTVDSAWLGQLDTNTSARGVTLRGGVEVNQYGAPVAYHIQKTHPGDRYWMFTGNAMQWERIPAKTAWGRRRVIHAHDKGRAGQTRGVPALASILKEFKVLGDYRSAELKCAAVNGMVALITESAMNQEQLAELLGANPDALEAYQEGLANRNRSAIPFREGLQVPLMLGEKLSGFTPTRPASNFDPFVTAVFRQMSTGLNMPYELLMKDFSKSNYSSARAALLEAYRFFYGKRQWLAMQFYQPCYELFMEEMVAAGKIEGLTLNEFYANKTAWCRARWIGPGRGWVDPLKEAQASELRMDIFVSTLEDECAEQGKDWEDVLEQAAEEQARFKELGLTRAQVVKNLQPKGATDAPAQTPEELADTGAA
jgi:lambda family phage portal protein